MAPYVLAAIYIKGHYRRLLRKSIAGLYAEKDASGGGGRDSIWLANIPLKLATPMYFTGEAGNYAAPAAIRASFLPLYKAITLRTKYSILIHNCFIVSP
jgi:hypothetical protein